MGDNSFTDATLVLLGHGSTQSELAGAPIYQHAAELRRRGIFREVREAFWKQSPQVGEVLQSITSQRVFIVPLFISEGYFASEVIPQELGFAGSGVLKNASGSHIYCAPVGTHPGMTKVLLARAQEVMERFPFPRPPQAKDTTLIIAGHGTERNENSRASIERQRTLILEMNLFAAVHTVFMEESPRIGECYTLASTRRLVVIPYFISEGMHTREDIPILLGEPERIVKQRAAAGQPTWRNPTERNGKLVWYGEAVGTAPTVADVILERAREGAVQ